METVHFQLLLNRVWVRHPARMRIPSSPSSTDFFLFHLEGCGSAFGLGQGGRYAGPVGADHGVKDWNLRAHRQSRSPRPFMQMGR